MFWASGHCQWSSHCVGRNTTTTSLSMWWGIFALGNTGPSLWTKQHVFITSFTRFFYLSSSMFTFFRWSSAPPQCKPLSCGYPHVEDPHALVEKSPYNIQRSQGAGIGDEASIACQAGFQMVISNSSGGRGGKALMEVVDRIKVICNKEGMWEKPFHYYCHNATTTKVRSNSLNVECEL